VTKSSWGTTNDKQTEIPVLEHDEFEPDLDLTKEDEYPAGLKEETHDRLLSYLQHRLDLGNQNRSDMLRRQMLIDRAISTWQKLSAADSERRKKQESDNKPQATSMNLPLVHTHLEDMVSFFSAIYSPTNGDFLAVPDSEVEQQGKALIEKLNIDAKTGRYFTQLCRVVRAALKYNLAGFHLEWIMAEQNQSDVAQRNYAEALDMYNFMWDSEISNPALISKEAEWAARIYLKNRRYIVEQDGDEFVGVSPVLDAETNGQTAKYYRYPPSAAGLSFEDETTSRNGSADWAAYGASLTGDAVVPVKGFEIVDMYCWLNPADFELDGKKKGAADYKPGYALYRFKILGNERIVSAELMESQGEKAEIPIYAGYLNQDEMGAAQRSQAELMAPFQTYSSFLLNADVAGARGTIWGLQGYDPSMFDLGSLPEGATTGRVASKIPGRDVRSGILSLNGQYDTSKTMEKLGGMLQLFQQFFPSQALPNQIAGIDRAISSQVAAVMQGVSRRLHMLVRILDDDIMNPFRMAAYRNLIDHNAVNLQGLTDDKARKILGSGLQQLNREAASQAVQQLLFAIIQNPESAQTMNIPALMNFWGSLLNMSVDLTKFQNQPPQGAPGAPVPGQPPAAGG
jgi:hypothetical protein